MHELIACFACSGQYDFEVSATQSFEPYRQATS
jgi:hypothetical protein